MCSPSAYHTSHNKEKKQGRLLEVLGIETTNGYQSSYTKY